MIFGVAAASIFPVVSPGPRTNAELVRKFLVALHACHATLPVSTSKLSTKAPSPPYQHENFTKCLLPKMVKNSKFWSHIVRSFSTHFLYFASHHFIFSNSEGITFSANCLCQKDRRTLPGKYFMPKFDSFSFVKCSVCHCSLSSFSH
jgi:hypothetical protein